ncbi:hypothetical protein EFE21_09260 [Lactococcus lactis subsp. lactis]|uniref:hypothetical protein n=1 Tax=Lactococcus lactis TaxID=1358 RepID=UPI00223AE46F|nr:hypothetical protein [Lactococcus lactis]MCT0032978.1 hypothetical protein [Lactococcus lactis subsp. lactis]
MKEYKVNTTTFSSTKKRNKSILIIKSDSDFKVGDDLELICFAYGNYYHESEDKVLLDGDRPWGCLEITDKDNADRLKTKITCVLSASEVNEEGKAAFENKLLPIIKSEGRSNGYDDFIKVLKNAFKSDQLPDGNVILGIEVAK